MPIPAIRKNTPQTIQSGGTTPPPQSTPRPSAASIADDAAGRIDELRGNLFAHEGAAMGGVALGTFVAGIAVGVMIHHAAEENREAFIAAGREQLGL